MKVAVATTIAAHKCDGLGDLAWMKSAEAMSAFAKKVGIELDWILAAEVGHGADGKLKPITDRLGELGGKVLRFSIERPGVEEITGHNRLWGICTGRNLALSEALDSHADWLFSVDTDIEYSPATILKLLELAERAGGSPRCFGINVGAYCLDGPPVLGMPAEWRVKEHWNTAGCLFIPRAIYEKVRWRWDLTDGDSDDPAFQHDVEARFGTRTWVRHDLALRHLVPPGLHHAVPILKSQARSDAAQRRRELAQKAKAHRRRLQAK